MIGKDTNRPNVLLICVDHWPGYLLGSAGHPCVMTPTLDQLAANGVRFTNAYSATPTCIPARRGLMTGTTARKHGDRVFNEKLPMPDIPTLAESFSNAGYQTYAVGTMTRMMRDANFERIDVYPAWDGLPLYDANEWVIYVAEKGAST